MSNTRIMIDIETLDTAPTAKIAEIGWCVIPSSLSVYNFSSDFAADTISVTPVGQEFLRLTESPATLEWWQDSAVRRAQLKKHIENGLPLQDALAQLVKVIEIFRPMEVWCKGSSFDFAILRNAFAVSGMEIPWSYSIERDLRTLQSLVDADWRQKEQERAVLEYKLTLHTAKDDAILQAIMTCKIAGLMALRNF